MNCQVFFGIFAICVGFCFAGVLIRTDSPTNGTSEVLNATIQEMVGDQNGTANLFDAIEKDSLAGVKYWFRQDPSSINRKNRYGHLTPLHEASKKGDLAIVQFLLSKGAEVDPVNSINYTSPLILASVEGHVPVVEALLDKGANINLQVKFKVTALHGAVLHNKLPVVKVLINRGADKSIRDIDNRTPLYYAKSFGFKPIDDYLSSH